MMDCTPASAAPSAPQPDAWRVNVAAIVMDAAGRVLLGLGRGHNAYWHFPQGGVGSRETLEDALRRELREEVGLAAEAYRIVASYGGLRYRYRKNNDKRDRWRGQEQTYFLLHCHEEMPPTDCTRTEEFATLTWVPWRQLHVELFAPFKRKVVEKVLATFFPEQVADVQSYADSQLTTRRYRYGGQPLSDIKAADTALFAGGKDEMAASMNKLALRLRAAQKEYAARAGRLLVLLHGAGGSGRKQCLRRLAALLDPFAVQHSVQVNAFSPGMPWGLLENLPAQGGVSLLLHAPGAFAAAPHDWQQLESWLTGQGIRLLKLYLLAAEADAEHAHVEPEHLADNALLAATDSASAPWYIIPADRRWYRDYVVTTLVAETMEARSL